MSITSPLRQHYSPLFSVSSYPPKPSLQLNTTLVLLFHMMTTISVSATTPHRFMLWFFPLFMAKITKVHMYENYLDGKIYFPTGVIVWMGPVSVVTWAFTAFLPHAFILKEPTQPIPMIRMMKIFQTWLTRKYFMWAFTSTKFVENKGDQLSSPLWEGKRWIRQNIWYWNMVNIWYRSLLNASNITK